MQGLFLKNFGHPGSARNASFIIKNARTVNWAPGSCKKPLSFAGKLEALFTMNVKISIIFGRNIWFCAEEKFIFYLHFTGGNGIIILNYRTKTIK